MGIIIPISWTRKMNKNLCPCNIPVRLRYAKQTFRYLEVGWPQKSGQALSVSFSLPPRGQSGEDPRLSFCLHSGHTHLPWFRLLTVLARIHSFIRLVNISEHSGQNLPSLGSEISDVIPALGRWWGQDTVHIGHRAVGDAKRSFRKEVVPVGIWRLSRK